jgi:hypothetical protein
MIHGHLSYTRISTMLTDVTTAQNKLGERGMAFGKRLGRLKTSAGHGPGLVFHSIRKTVATALQDAGCPEPTAADWD